MLSSCADKAKPAGGAEMRQQQDESFAGLRAKACAYLNKQQAISDSIYHIRDYQHWYYDQATGVLTFSSKGLPTLSIDYEEVGSVSWKSNTWLWAWDNPYLEKQVKSEIGLVRKYGSSRGQEFRKLVQPIWTGDECDGWEMASVAAYLMQAKGAYRIPSPENKLYSFLIFKAIHRADSVESK